jgi:hypothetical protein
VTEEKRRAERKLRSIRAEKQEEENLPEEREMKKRRIRNEEIKGKWK